MHVSVKLTDGLDLAETEGGRAAELTTSRVEGGGVAADRTHARCVPKLRQEFNNAGS
jgi:hypothetical protein